MRTMIENYRNIPAGHCGSGAMRNLIHHYCGLELEEGVVFGLGAGLDCVYFSYAQAEPPFMLFGRGSSMEADLAHTLGLDYTEQTQDDDEAAWQAVRAEVLAGRPTMLSGDIFYLDYREFKVHFPGHRFVLLGFDDASEEVYIADRINDYPETCSLGALKLSRNSPVGMTGSNLWGKFSSPAQRNSLPEACGRALRISVERMHGVDRSQFDNMRAPVGKAGGDIATGLEGLRLFAEHVRAWPQDPDAAAYARYVDNAIIKYGTGGGFFRNHYAVFMAWSREQRPDLVSSTVVGLAERAAQQWNGLSPLMQQLATDPADSTCWQAASEQLDDIIETEYSLFGYLGDTVLRAA
jgi:hypothetical protein